MQHICAKNGPKNVLPLFKEDFHRPNSALNPLIYVSSESSYAVEDRCRGKKDAVESIHL